MSKLLDNTRAAFTSLFSNKMRALLTTLGIGIGIASVIILISLGNSVQNYVSRQFMSAGSDVVYVMPATTFGAPMGAGRGGMLSSSLTERDLALISDPFNVPNVKTVAPV
ncbi:MAG TPA: ABC transporter permease, partial [Aggregatilineales bacterium]|nr:ABC transporter permease [Aggregatilineales bacterium]